MKLLLVNGSPRGGKGNTQVLLDRLAEGFLETAGNGVETVRLRDAGNAAEAAGRFHGCDMLVLAFPLYIDSMPAVVKEYIEALEPYCRNPGNPVIGFVVISGFPEAVHTAYIKRYLQKLAGRLGCPYAGTVTRGNAEGIRWGSQKQNEKLFAAFRGFGGNLAQSGRFDEQAARQTAGVFRFSGLTRGIYSFLRALGLTDRGLNGILRRNNAFGKRFDQPYAP